MVPAGPDAERRRRCSPMIRYPSARQRRQDGAGWRAPHGAGRGPRRSVMSLFGKNDPPQPPPAAPSRGGSSTGGVPAHALQRLREMRGDGQQAALFTSDLSVNEFLLVKQAGFQPLGLVIGSSIYHIGYQQSSWKKSMEMSVLSQAMYEARELAMTRMEEEADQLDADGIVGVRLEVNRYAWGEHLAEFIAIGTAIRHRQGEHYRTPRNRPFTSDLSGQDFWTLLRS